MYAINDSLILIKITIMMTPILIMKSVEAIDMKLG